MSNPHREFSILGEIAEIENIAIGHGIRELATLRRKYGDGNWRKLKGIAVVQLESGALREVELHWYECHGIGKRDIKIKRTIRYL